MLPPKLDHMDNQLTGHENQPLQVLSCYVAQLTWQGKTSAQNLYVQSLTIPLLGFPVLQAVTATQEQKGCMQVLCAMEKRYDWQHGKQGFNMNKSGEKRKAQKT